MRYARMLLCLLIAAFHIHYWTPMAHAASPSVTIEQMYPGMTNAAAQEFIELFNDSADPVDVTGWCVSYISSSGATTTKLTCLNAPDASTRLWLKAGGYALFVSNEYNAVIPVHADALFSGGISATAGHTRLTDAAGTEIDRLGWGTAANPETTAVSAPASGKSLQRKISGTSYQDTNNNANDFQQVTPALHASDVYEVVTVVDVCPNVAGNQATMPTGYLADTGGNCQPDSCLNIDGLQVSVPAFYDSDGSGNCTPHDECDNVSGIQDRVPANMVRTGQNDCSWDIAPLRLTEVLPNAIGSDSGNEFVEVYNPTDHVIDLNPYSIRTGINADKTYAFPSGATIAPGEYRAFSDSAMKFTLVNTSSRVVLSAIDGSVFGDTGTYDSPAEGTSWALLDNAWTYTNQPTPGAANAPSIADEAPTTDSTDSGAAPCPTGKYRNPLTNRCRNIATDANMLSTCDADQYRSPETGRCRKLSFASITPCKDGQYRSEETNRCRNILTASAAKPCKDSQYRSEETGRCRNVPPSSVPDAGFAVQPVKETGMAFVGWWALGGAGLLAAAYAGWEWRQELAALWRNGINRFR